MSEESEKRRARHLKAEYGLTVEEFDQLWEAQDGKCAICGRAFAYPGSSQDGPPPQIDHDHKTKVIRGLLCATDNRFTVGRITDPQPLYMAAAYLRYPPAVQVLGERTVPKKTKRRKGKRGVRT